MGRVTRQSTRQANRVDPLARSDTTPLPSFDCTACLDTFQATPVIIHGDALCEDCFTTGVATQFHNALKDKTQYPVRWGGQEVQIDGFARFFSKQFLREWKIKKEEYLTPVPDRLYCVDTACTKFLGQRSRHRSTKRCSCGGRTCADCRDSITTIPHVCKEQIDRFAGLSRGRDYQLCPGCSAPVEISSGCNHMICEMCDTNFCYICGEGGTDAHSGHWDRGKPCPRFNQPGSAGAIFDRPVADRPERAWLDVHPFAERPELTDEVRRLIDQGVLAASTADPPPDDATGAELLRDFGRRNLWALQEAHCNVSETQTSSSPGTRMENSTTKPTETI